MYRDHHPTEESAGGIDSERGVERCTWSVSLVSEAYTIIVDSYSTDTDARTIMTATGVPWARWNTRTVKIVETSLT